MGFVWAEWNCSTFIASSSLPLASYSILKDESSGASTIHVEVSKGSVSIKCHQEAEEARLVHSRINRFKLFPKSSMP